MSILPNKSSIKALALDLDGTVLRPGAILSDRTAAVINACRERSLHIIICTGRSMGGMTEKFREAFGTSGPMVYFNGAVVADMPGDKILHASLLETGAVEACVDFARDKDIYYQVFFPGNREHPKPFLMAEREGAERDQYGGHTGIYSMIGDLKETLKGPGVTGAIKSMFLAEPEIQDNVLRPFLQERFGDSVYMARTQPTYLEVLNAKASKGSGLKIALEYRGLKPEETIAFGDEENDLPMFRLASFSVAPSSAKETVKAAASLVSGPCEEDGVAAFLEETFLS
ncbi:MAG: Cof-type HAD-IIB family hydrolase [Treponema sp.]|jgi:Cof subfamily protein (haloacid dehalogenase superfamily)|nr:Cof-type HAD-IIB family hydrolase [Treponema sp.]